LAVSGVLVVLAFVLLLGTALVMTGPDGGPARAPGDDDVPGAGHDPIDTGTDMPVVDACESSPEMCGEGAGGADLGACDQSEMCGDIVPGPDEQEIDAGAGPCVGELCGDIGPGEDDGGRP
jgi:hypothetical protein